MQWIIKRTDATKIPAWKHNTHQGRRDIERGMLVIHPQTKAIIRRFEIPVRLTLPNEIGEYVARKISSMPAPRFLAVRGANLVSYCDSVLL